MSHYGFYIAFFVGAFSGWQVTMRYFKGEIWQLQEQIRLKRLQVQADAIDLERDELLNQRLGRK